MHDVRLLRGQDAAQPSDDLRIGGRREVTPVRLLVDLPEPPEEAFDAMDAHTVFVFVRRRAIEAQRSHRDLVSSSEELSRQVLDNALLAARDRREELREHQDLHPAEDTTDA